MTHFYPLRVSEVQTLTTQSVAITFEIPKEIASPFTFMAGQYITLKHKINGHEVRRAYSISSAPVISGVQTHFTVGIKEVAGGAFSTYANRYIQQGDTLEVMPPQGRFFYDPLATPNSKKQVLAIAAGSGITPMMAIASTVLRENNNNTFCLIYGNKTKQDTMFASEIQLLKNTYGSRFMLQEVFSQAKEEGALFGRIDQGAINYTLKNLDTTPLYAAYLCGPIGMIETATETLKSVRLAPEKIHFELFTVATQDNTTKNATAEPQNKGAISVAVTVDGETSHIEMESKTILLDAIIKEDIDAPYSCQGGVCSSCICKVTAGSATMLKNQILTDSEIADGLVLSCQAMVTSPSVAVDFDDV